MSLRFTTTVLLKDVDVEIEVECNPGVSRPAKLSGHPDSWHPDESEGPEIHAVLALRRDGSAGKDVLRRLGVEVVERLIREAWKAGEAANEDPRDEPDDYDDSDDYHGP